MADRTASAARAGPGGPAGAWRPAAFAGISGRKELRPADLLGLARDAFRRADYATAWLISDRLVRISGKADPLPLVLRASALARLGHAARSSEDLALAAFADPFDRFANEALIASADIVAGEKALLRLAAATEPPAPSSLAAQLQRRGKAALIRCEADAAGITLLGLATALMTLRVGWSGERRSDAIDLALATPGADGQPPYVGQVTLAWPSDETAVAFTPDRADVLVHPATVLRPADARPSAAPAAAAAPGLMVIVPVYDDAEATRACFAALLANLPREGAVRVVAVDDKTPDPAIAAFLDTLAADGRIVLVRNRVNLGFAASVNRALAMRRPGEDAALVNADTIVPPDALARLRTVLRRRQDIGTVTPLSNNGEDTSVPCRFRSSPLGTAEEVAALNALAWQANGETTVPLPNGVGFCMLIGARLLDVRPYLPTAFGRGYFEDVAYCLAARDLGFANVCATGVYVGHAGSRSFQDDKRWLVRHNLERLGRHFPDYRAETDRFFADDPLLPQAARLEAAWLGRQRGLGLVLTDRPQDPATIRRAAASLELPSGRLVFATIATGDGGSVLKLRGVGQAMPQNLDLRLDVEAEAAQAARYLSRAAAVLAVDPQHLPQAAVNLIRKAGVRPAALLTSHVGGLPLAAGWTDRFAPRHVPTERLASHLRKTGLGVSLVDARPVLVPAPRRPLRGDVLYLVHAAGEAPADRLITRLSAAFAAAPKLRFTLAVLAEPTAERLADHVAWVGAIDDDDLIDWLHFAGYGPTLFASRRHGIADERADLWAQAGIPVAFFDPDVAEPQREGRRLMLPCAMSDDAAAEVVNRWMASLVRAA